MQTIEKTKPAEGGMRRWAGLIAPALFAVAIAPVVAQSAQYIARRGVESIGFDAALWASQPTVLQAHVLGAVGALAIGLLIFANAKGRLAHRILGWTWTALMAVTAGTSLFITGLNGDAYSLIHLLSGWVLIALPLAIIAARRHDVARHRKGMTGMFLGGLVIAGAFTFLPGRLMWTLFFGG